MAKSGFPPILSIFKGDTALTNYFCTTRFSAHIMKFKDYRIDPIIRENLARLGFERPTDIQYKTIPPILHRQDVLAIAQTGTGKTAAFVIPIVHQLLQNKNNSLRCLVMVPTHELAIQISKVFDEVAKGTKLRSLALFGGVQQEPQIKELQKGIDVLITTPGRMFDLRSQGHLELSNVQFLILDEADHMLDLGFIKDIRDVLRYLPSKKQTLFFSATINDRIKKLAYSVVNNPIRIQISPKDPVSKNIDHSLMMVKMDDKRFFLERIVRENPESKILVFVRTKVRSERVMKAMDRVEIKANTIHGGLTQEERSSTLESFRSGVCSLLIATDVTARGIDIAGVDMVVNYDMPEEPDKYVHRVGRTGRGKLKGLAVSFCSPEEEELKVNIEKYLAKDVKILSLDNNMYEDTLDFSMDAASDWKSLMKKDEEELNQPKKKKKK
jgi:ATP-dependent RNA helicase RhlE